MHTTKTTETEQRKPTTQHKKKNKNAHETYIKPDKTQQIGNTHAHSKQNEHNQTAKNVKLKTNQKAKLGNEREQMKPNS